MKETKYKNIRNSDHVYSNRMKYTKLLDTRIAKFHEKLKEKSPIYKNKSRSKSRRATSPQLPNRSFSPIQVVITEKKLTESKYTIIIS